MSKRMISIILTLTLVASLSIVFAPEAQAVTFGPFTVSNMTWRVEIPTGANSGTLYIDRNTSSGVPATVAIPNYSRGGAPWYAHSAQVDSIVIGSGISSIGSWAFADFNRVTGVAVLGNITSIGNDAFRECTNLQGFKSTATGPWVDKAFDGLTSIGDRAFYNCYSLANLWVQNLSSVGAEAFTGCKSIQSINAGSTGNVRTVNGILVGMNTANPQQVVRVIKAPVSILGNTGPGVFDIGLVTTTNTITTIEAEAFAYLRNITDVIIPASVTVIRDRAFAFIGSLDPGSPSSLRTATFMGDAPTAANFGSNVFQGINDSDFEIVYFPHGLRWTTPRWNGYRTTINTSRISLDKYVIVMQEGAEAELRATVFPATASQAVSWDFTPGAPIDIVTVTGKNRDDDSIAIVNALKPGMTTILATAINSGAIVECTVIVLERQVSATTVLLDKSQLSIGINATAVPDLTAIVYPYPSDVAQQENVARELVWTSSNPSVAIVDPGTASSLTRSLVIRSVGTTTITVSTKDGLSKATCVVTVTAAPVFVPVTSVTLSVSSIAMGSETPLNDYAAVLPANATFNTSDRPDLNIISWRVVPELTNVDVVTDTDGTLPRGNLSVPWGQTGTVVIDAVVPRGRADVSWGFSSDEPYTQRFTISVLPFIPVTNITDVPLLAFVGKPLQMRGTVNPAGTAYRDITWEMTGTTAGAQFDPVSRMVTAQWPGIINMKATVANGRVDTNGMAQSYTQTFTIFVEPYITNTLTLNANPGGFVSPSGTRQLAGGEELQITATPQTGYIFSGWSTTNGGSFANANSAATVFTMPGNATNVTAYFTFIGLPGGTVGGSGGGVVLPTPVHYFTNGSIYYRNSGVSFGHVTIRDYQFFSHVTLNGQTLARNAHYTVSQQGGFTQIILANGYLDGLYQGAHTLQVHFTDFVTVTAVFTVLWGGQVSSVYNDVYSSDWYYSSVLYVSERGWMSARSSEPGRFRPSDQVTQGEVIDAMYSMAGSPTITNVNNQTLQGRDASYEWTRANSIQPLGGFYNLNSPVSRQDLMVLFGRMVSVLRLRYPVVRQAPVFADEWQIDPLARSHVTDLYRAGIINGRSASTFDPNSVMSRAEFATFLRQFSVAMGYW